MKSDTTRTEKLKEYFRMIKVILKFEINSGNIVNSIDSNVVSRVRYVWYCECK